LVEFVASQFGFSLILAVVVMGVLLTAVAYSIYFERKIAAWIQDRYGPNRVGPWGLLQPLADGVKFILKEDYIPEKVDKPLFILAPAVIFIVAMVGFVVIPWGGTLDLSTVPLVGDAFKPGTMVEVQVASINIGLLYLLAVMSMGVYGVVLGGWASNNKYSFYGAMRACAQMVSYEIPLGICVLVIVLTTGSLRLEDIVASQAGSLWDWHVFKHPLVFLILLVTALAEANRAPFDLAEAEQELVGGYHTEYSAMKFALFFLAEYVSLITSSAMIVVLFLGGWHFPWIAEGGAGATSFWAVCVEMLVFCGKIAAMMFLFMWTRWTLPRFRFDQLMRLAWKGLVPISLALFVLTTGLLYFNVHQTVFWPLAGNLAILAATLFFASISKVAVTGRQANLPSVAPA